MTYTATVLNETGFPVSGAVVSAVIPVGLSLTTATAGTGSYDSETGVWTIGSLANAATATLTLECLVTASDGDEIECSFHVSGTAATVGLKSDTVTVRAFVGDLDTRAAAYQTAESNTVPIGGEPESDWSASAGASGSGVTWILPGRAARQDCVASSARIWVNTLGAGGWKLKHFRWDGSTYVYQAERAITPTTTGVQTVTFADLTVQMGDVLGIYAPADGKLETIDCDLYTGVRFANGDITADNGFSEVAYGIPLDVYGGRPYLAATGDSLAAGRNGSPNFWDCWLWDENKGAIPGGEPTSEVWNQIRADNAHLEYQNHALGSQDWLWTLNTATGYVTACDPHTVVVICGTNDISWGLAWSDVEARMTAIKAALDADEVRRMAVCEVLPRTEFTDAESLTVRQWNARYATWCKRNGAQLIICHDAMGEERLSTGELDNLPAAYDAGDGIHLSTAGVEALSELIQAQL